MSEHNKVSRIADYKASRSPSDIIESDGTAEGMASAIGKAVNADDGKSFNQDRPYNGQSHTDQGARGKQVIFNLTMRDVSDCMALGIMLASGPGEPYTKADNGTALRGDLYTVDLSDIDPGAAIQNAMCEIEKRMGIYPNIPANIPELEDR